MTGVSESKERVSCSSRGHRHVSHLLKQVGCTFQTCLSLVSNIPLAEDDQLAPDLSWATEVTLFPAAPWSDIYHSPGGSQKLLIERKNTSFVAEGMIRFKTLGVHWMFVLLGLAGDSALPLSVSKALCMWDLCDKGQVSWICCRAWGPLKTGNLTDCSLTALA